MLITIQRGTGTSRVGYSLTGNTRDFPPPSNYVETPASIDQVATGLRWTDVEVYDRGNEQTTIEFDSYQQHDTVAKAETFITELIAKLRGRWNVYIGTGTGKTGVRWIQNALVRPTSLAYQGLNTTVHYRITGGRIRNNAEDTA